MTDHPNLKPEDRALIEAAEELLTAYRERYAKPSTSGVRANAPLQREMGELKIALDAARAEGRRSPGGGGEALAPGDGWARDWLTDALAKAYEDGAQDVHDNYEPNPDPEFGEAAREYAVNFVEGLPPVSSPPPSGEVREASPDLLAWLADHRRLELDYGFDAEEEDMFWRVHERSGNVNDREWDLIGQGETPLAALLSAKSYLEAKSADLTA